MVTACGFGFPLVMYYQPEWKEFAFFLLPLVLPLAGFLQWILLRGKVPQAGWWVLITALSFLLAFLVTISDNLPLEILALVRFKGVAQHESYVWAEWTPAVQRASQFVENGARLVMWTLAEAGRGLFLHYGFQPARKEDPAGQQSPAGAS